MESKSRAIKKILIDADGKRFYIRDLTQDYHTQFGFVSKAVLAKAKGGSVVRTNTGKELSVFEPSFIDKYYKIKRAPQIIPLKDIAAIIATTGIGKGSVIVDAGTGSGALTLFLANIAKKVISYEIREDFAKVGAENVATVGMNNVILKNRSIYDGIDEKNVDVVTLDLPEPWLALPHAVKALKSGGFVVSYSPSIPQVSDFVSAALKQKGVMHVKTIEIIEREWDIDERIIRPKSQPIGHSGFLTFLRKIRQ